MTHRDALLGQALLSDLVNFIHFLDVRDMFICSWLTCQTRTEKVHVCSVECTQQVSRQMQLFKEQSDLACLPSIHFPLASTQHRHRSGKRTDRCIVVIEDTCRLTILLLGLDSIEGSLVR